MKKSPETSHELWHGDMYDVHHLTHRLNAPRAKTTARKEAAFAAEKMGKARSRSWLDVACGIGIASAFLQRKGFKTVGVDINPLCIQEARRHFPLCHFDVGNMYDLRKYRNSFDIVSSFHTSFGYFSDDQQNEAVLEEMVSCIRPGGYFILNAINRDHLLSIFKPFSWEQGKDEDVISFRSYNAATKYLENTTVYLNKKTKKYSRNYHRLRLYSKPEMLALFDKAGLTSVKVYNGHNGGCFHKTNSVCPFYIGRKLNP